MLFFGAVLFSFPAFASEPRKAVLFTSIGLPEDASDRLERRRDAKAEKIERIFVKGIRELGLEPVVIHHGDQYHLWSALHDKSVKGIFWASHAAYLPGGGPGMDFGGILDERSFVINPVFQDAHPELKLLALIGCQSKQVAEKWRDRSSAEVIGFDRKVTPGPALRDALKLARRSLMARRGKDPGCSDRIGYPLRLIRRLPEASKLPRGWERFPAARVESGVGVIGVFPSGLPGEAQEISVFLQVDPTYPASEQMELTLTTGSSLRARPAGFLGQMEVSADWAHAGWRLFTQPSGEPYGVESNIYLYEGDEPGTPDRRCG